MPPPQSTGRGFTKNEIYIGFGTFKAIDDSLGKFGLNVTYGDQEAHPQAVIKDINASGGVAGRKIVLVFYDFQADDVANSPSAGAQKACEKWTHDRPVFAVINYFDIAPSELLSCLAKRSTPWISQAPVQFPQSVLSRHAPYLYAPSWPSAERLIATRVSRAESSDFFAGWDNLNGRPGAGKAKIGVIARADRWGSDFIRATREQLSRRGKSVTAEWIQPMQVADASNEINQAVLRFKQTGVTHVISSNSPALFMRASDSQNYFPRYLVDSFSFPRTLQDNASEGQLRGTLGVGFLPGFDVDNERDPGDFSASRTQCRKLMDRAGQNTSVGSAFGAMTLVCDAFKFLVTALKSGNLSPDGMQRGVTKMGSMPSASTFKITFPGGRKDGTSAVRDFAWRNNCKCFVYTSSKNHGM